MSQAQPPIDTRRADWRGIGFGVTVILLDMLFFIYLYQSAPPL
jgi:hypothetical protein